MRIARSHLTSAACALAVLAAASASGAAPLAPSADARAMAETLFFTGRGLLEAERFAEACEKFAESYRLDAASGTLLNLAVCHEKAGQIASAWGEFRQAEVEARKAGRADREKLAREHADALEPALPHLTIEVPPAARVPELEVVRNGSPLRAGGFGLELPVDPGTVTIVVRAPGYLQKVVKLTVARAERRTVAVPTLEKAPVPVIVAKEPGWSTRKKVGLATIGLGVLSAGVAGYFGWSALDARSKSDDACPVVLGERRCTEGGSAAMSRANTYAWVANAGAAVSVLSLGIGAWLFLTGQAAAPVTGAAPRPRVTATLGVAPGATFAHVQGAF